MFWVYTFIFISCVVTKHQAFLLSSLNQSACMRELSSTAPHCQFESIFAELRELNAKYERLEKKSLAQSTGIASENKTLGNLQREIDFLSLRLTGSGTYTGAVEIYVRGIWGTVCSHGWDDNDANVVCKTLGYHSGKTTTVSATTGKPHVMSDLACTGSETSVFDCQYSSLTTSSPCISGQAASVICDIGVRLVDGADSKRGRVEVSHQGQWGTVCDDGWDDQDATVVCKMLGFRKGKAYSDATFGEGNGLIILDHVQCTGTETSIIECNHTEFGYNNCAHSEDASVVCSH